MVEECLCCVVYYSECFWAGCCWWVKRRHECRCPFDHCAGECLKSNVVVAGVVDVVVH